MPQMQASARVQWCSSSQPALFMRCVLLKDWHEQEKARPHYRAFSLLSMNPGLAYVAGAWQVAADVIVPINNEGGRTIGMRAHLFLFLDDLFPACSENHF
jgi:hypothetical protein